MVLCSKFYEVFHDFQNEKNCAIYMGKDDIRKQINPQSTKIKTQSQVIYTKKIQEKEVFWFKPGVTKRCRLPWPSYMSPNAEGGGCGFSANEYSCAHGAQINFGDLRTYPGVSLKEAASILDRSLLLRFRLVRFFSPAIS
jgi:hypothetical protein